MSERERRPCLSPVELDEFLVSTHADAGIEAHLDSCTTCRAALDEHRANNELLRQLRESSADVPMLEPDQLAAGQVTIEGYDVLEEIHRGAQGVVFRAHQQSANRTVALKLLLAGAFATSVQRRRFEREIELVANLEHPNIVTIFESGTTDAGQLYFAMQFVDGEPLSAWVERELQAKNAGERKSAVRDAIRLFIKVSRAVNHAHLHGVIHRDLKPANILVDRHGEPHVVDFGLAKVVETLEHDKTTRDVTQVGLFMGTAAYASPEQASADSRGIDIRSDVYSLGVILYEMITGALPFDESSNLSDIIRAITERDAPRPTSRNQSGLPIDRDLETIILKAMARERDRRYQSAAALADDLDRYLAGHAIDARRDSRWYVLRKAIARHKTAAAVAAAFILLLATSSVAMTVLYNRATTQANKVRTINIFLEDTIASIEPGKPGVATMRDFFDEARHWVELVLGDDPEAEASVRLIVGNGYRNLGRFTDAERELQRSVDIRKSLYGENDVEYAKGLNAFGQLRFSEGKLDEAAELIGRALAIRLEQLGEQSLDVALNQGTLSRVYVAQGRLDEAEALLRQSLATREALLGREHTDVAMAMFGLAEVTRRQGDLAQAQSLHEEALSIRRKVIHMLHPDLPRSLLAIGDVMLAQGRASEARPLIAEAVELRQRGLPEGHWRIAEAKCALAICFAALDEREEAQSLHTEAIEALRTALGDDDPLVVRAEEQFAAAIE